MKTPFSHTIFIVQHKYRRSSPNGRICYPNGPRVTPATYESTLSYAAREIQSAVQQMRQSGLSDKTFLEMENTQVPLPDFLVHRTPNLASALYSNSIHPIFFLAAIKVIGDHGEALFPCVSTIDLANLGRTPIFSALRAKDQARRISAEDFGTDLYRFRDSINDSNKIDMLRRLGVLVFVEGAILTLHQEELQLVADSSGSLPTASTTTSATGEQQSLFGGKEDT